VGHPTRLPQTTTDIFGLERKPGLMRFDGVRFVSCNHLRERIAVNPASILCSERGWKSVDWNQYGLARWRMET